MKKYNKDILDVYIHGNSGTCILALNKSNNLYSGYKLNNTDGGDINQYEYRTDWSNSFERANRYSLSKYKTNAKILLNRIEVDEEFKTLVEDIFGGYEEEIKYNDTCFCLNLCLQSLGTIILLRYNVVYPIIHELERLEPLLTKFFHYFLYYVLKQQCFF